MKVGPDIAETAALLGDPARANMLLALLSGRALTASELANEGGVSKSTASSHLARLETGGLIAQAREGRHRYFRLAGADVAEVLERLLTLSARAGRVRTRQGPKEPELRESRVCYDHLAGTRGVRLLDSLVARDLVARTGDDLALTETGRAFFHRLGVSVPSDSRRVQCRACLDWSERRHHLAGSLGAVLLEHIYSRGLGARLEGTRVVRFSAAGKRWFDETFPTDGGLA